MNSKLNHIENWLELAREANWSEKEMVKAIVNKLHPALRLMINALLCPVIFLIAFRPIYVAGVEFHVEGHAQDDSFKGADVQPFLSKTLHFSLSVKDSNWIMHIDCLSTRTNKKPPPPSIGMVSVSNLTLLESYTVDAGTDGTNNYLLFSYEIPQTHGYHTNTQIVSGVVPHFDTMPIVGILWYAFASECYLNDAKGDSLEIPFVPILRNQFDFDYVFKASWKRSIESPHLPTEIYFRAPGTRKYWIQLFDALSKPPLLEPLKSPFDHGYTIASFNATRFRDVGGLSLPEQIAYKVFAPQLIAGSVPSPHGTNLFLVTRYLLDIDKAELGATELDFVPKAPSGVFRVNDLRFVKAKPPTLGLFYDATNSWPSAADVMRSLPYEKSVLHVRHLAAASLQGRALHPVTRWVLIGIMPFTSVVLIIIVRKTLKH